ncbi:MAG: arsenate reductase/protein-tyrosine-phosphatase family protein [Candidatus Helarchaeota archaeon]
MCTGNAGRSALAKIIFEHMAKNHLNPAINQLIVDSAGTHPSLEPDLELYPALEQLNVPKTTHIPKEVTIDLIEASDLILTMTKYQTQYIQELVPKSANKIHTFREYMESSGDVEDVVGSGIAAYVEMGKEFQTLIEQLFEKLLKLK